MASPDKKHLENYIQYKQAKDITVSDILIGENTYSFTLQSVPNLPISMFYPEGFEEMSAVSARAKYPSENRPDIILTNPADETVNLLFTQTKDAAASEDIPDIVQKLQTVIKRMNAGVVFHQTGIIETELGNIGWFDYGSSALDDDLYNLMYTLCVQDTLLIGGFCCLREHQRQWCPVVLQMLKTIMLREVDEV